MKMISYFHSNKTHFHKKGFALSLALKVTVLELGNGPFVSPMKEKFALFNMMKNNVEY